MPKLIKNKPYGVLQNGFFAAVDDYPIAGGWGLKGKLFAVGDASGFCTCLRWNIWPRNLEKY